MDASKVMKERLLVLVLTAYLIASFASISLIALAGYWWFDSSRPVVDWIDPEWPSSAPAMPRTSRVIRL